MTATRIKDLPLAERPRERLLQQGAENLKTEELIAILLRTGTAQETAIDLAQRLLVTFGGLAGLVRANFPCRLVGKVASVEDGRIAAGVSGTSAERLAGRGDFLLVVRGEVRRFQAGYASAADVRQVVAELAEGRRPMASASPRLAGSKAMSKTVSPPLPGFLRLKNRFPPGNALPAPGLLSFALFISPISPCAPE